MRKNKIKIFIVASLLAFGGSVFLPTSVVNADSNNDYETTTFNLKTRVSNFDNNSNLEESKVPMRLANPSIGAGGGSVAGGAGIAAGLAGLGAIHWFQEHTKNKRKSTHDKHTKPRAGRSSEKKKQSKNWNGKHRRH